MRDIHCDVLARSTWETGQDQCASIKRQLAAMLPGVSIFLDVSPRGLYAFVSVSAFNATAIPPFTRLFWL